MLHRLMYLSAIGAALLFFAESVEAGRRGGCGGGGRGHHARGGRGCGGGGCGGGGCVGGGCGGYAMGGPGGCGGGPIIYGGPRMGSGPGMGAMKGSGYEEEVNAPAPANLLVTLPADARLFVDGHETKSTTGERLLTTPDLQPGREYSYTLRAEVMRGGKVQETSQRVTVRAGQQTQVNIQIPEAVASR
jgi:uncharacterized protein (TIGR03000 family)